MRNFALLKPNQLRRISTWATRLLDLCSLTRIYGGIAKASDMVGSAIKELT